MKNARKRNRRHPADIRAYLGKNNAKKVCAPEGKSGPAGIIPACAD
jgi:hypothetical protein